MKDLNYPKINEERLRKLQNILENLQLKHNEKYLYQNCEVLVENKLKEQEKFFGRTKYMTSVIFESDGCKPGDLINVKITSFNKKNLFGLYKANKIKAA
jgi:tRNA-2-methylthio-N6-dimethylallyladenosine synthase